MSGHPSNSTLAWNSTDPCGFPDIKSLDKQIRQIDRQMAHHPSYNITQLFVECPQLCVLAYGDGNPDITGIGMMISFGIQLGTVLFTGPLLQLCVLIRQRKKPVSKRMFTFLDEIAQKVTDTNIVLATSFIVAATVRLLQVPPLSETDFINQTTVLQSCVVMSSLLASLSFGKTPWRKRIFYLVCCVSMIPELIVGHVVPWRPTMFKLAKEIGLVCGLEKELKSWNQLPPIAYLCIPTAMIGLLWVTLEYAESLIGLASRVTRNKLGNGHVNRIFLKMAASDEIIRSLGAGTGLLITTIGCGEWAQVQIRRAQMQEKMGQGYQDNFLGFGQVMAILVWVFLLEEIRSQFLKYKKSSSSGESGVDEDRHSLVYRTISNTSIPEQSYPYDSAWINNNKSDMVPQVYSMV